MDDLTLRDFVEDELEWEPRIDAASIGVAVEDGVVTLMGHVSSFAEKLAAEDAVKRVKGVRGIAQEIEVRLTGRPKTDDDEITSKAADVLDWDVSLPDNEIQVRVQNGWVTLSREVARVQPAGWSGCVKRDQRQKAGLAVRHQGTDREGSCPARENRSERHSCVRSRRQCGAGWCRGGLA